MGDGSVYVGDIPSLNYPRGAIGTLTSGLPSALSTYLVCVTAGPSPGFAFVRCTGVCKVGWNLRTGLQKVNWRVVPR